MDVKYGDVKVNSERSQVKELRRIRRLVQTTRNNVHLPSPTRKKQMRCEAADTSPQSLSWHESSSLTLLPNNSKFLSPLGPRHSSRSAKRRWRAPLWVIEPNEDQIGKLLDVNYLATSYAGRPNPGSLNFVIPILKTAICLSCRALPKRKNLAPSVE